MQKGLRIKEEVDTTPVDDSISNIKHHDNTVCPLCSLAWSVLFLLSCAQVSCEI